MPFSARGRGPLPKLPRQPEVNVGTAGHVDHGKTTLVQAVTGVWTSAHSEELRRGITIKVGYADGAIYRCKNHPEPDGYSTSETCPRDKAVGELVRVFSFVDCPGHESLMANMLSGAAVMDGGMLVIAANEPVPQPQSREHLLALQMLGMRNLVIVQNKVDLVSDAQARENYERIRAFVQGSVAEDAPIIPVSAQHRLNIDALLGAIVEVIKPPSKDPTAPPRLHVLRSFDVNLPGAGVTELKGGVVGGTLLQGEITTGAEVELRPGIMNERSGKYEPVSSEVVSLGTGAGLVDRVGPGGLIAVATKLDPALTKGDALVGSVVGLPGQLPPVHETLTMDVELFETAVGTPELVKVEKVRSGEPLRLNVGTAVSLGVVSSSRDGRVDISLKRPVCAASGSRAALSRRIADRWRLIGSAVIH